MEYLLGSLVSIALFIIGRAIFSNTDKKTITSGVIYSQSYIFSLIRPMLAYETASKKLNTQSSKHTDSQYVRVIIADHTAYWISNNVLYMAMEEDGFINKETAKPVDTMSMDKVQLEKVIFIVDTLTEGERDENWNSGNT